MAALAALVSKASIKSMVIDILTITALYFVPTMSHLISYPLYLFEPMRILLFVALAHTSRSNAYILAVTIPLFSFFVGSHPSAIKAGLMSIELASNIFLFYYLYQKSNKLLPSVILSVLLAKLLYYGGKFACISAGLLKMDLVSTPFIYQVIVVAIVSAYMVLVYGRIDKTAKQ